MKKVININFQGRVIPIEETAYDVLKQYVESLRMFFATEEGRDEIINDIEGRIAELFGEIIKKGSTCITDANVNNIINSMGRPEDFDDDEAKVHAKLSEEQSYQSYEKTASQPRGRLYRSENDKLLGGVCSGLASYLRVDPTIVRILFAIITFGGFGAGFLLYIILWIVVPSKTLEVNLKKRLYRNPDDRMIAGVSGGLAAYFDINVLIPRLIFALPLIAGIISSVFQNAFFNFDPFPAVFFGSFGTSLTVIYVVLWVVIPEANTATEKLEMKGAKVDLNSIANSIKEEMGGFRGRAEKIGEEFKDKATAWGAEFSQTANSKAQAFSAEAAPVGRRVGRRVGSAIGILFKAFFLFIAGVMVFALLMALLALMISGVSVFPLKNFFLEGYTENMLAWLTLLLFFGAPVIAFVTWIIRRVIGVKSKNRYLGYIFGGLWFIGLISGIALAASIANDFNAVAREKENFSVSQPSTGKLIVKVAESNVKVYGRWFKMSGLVSMNDDSIFLNNVRVRVVKSADSTYHTYYTKSSHADNEQKALSNARNINYQINQQDSLLYLSRGFSLIKGTRFRNQGVIVTIQVPVGKRIVMDRSISRKLNWFHVDGNRDWDDEWEQDEDWNDNVEYIMTSNGLERANKKHETEDAEENNDGDDNGVDQINKGKEELRKEIEKQQKELEEKKRQLEKAGDTTYHYHAWFQNKDANTNKIVKQTASAKMDINLRDTPMLRFEN